LLVSRESVRRLRRELGVAPRHRRRPPQGRRRRTPESAQGAKVQIDGSPFAWLGAGGPPLMLLGAIDDATSEILALQFRPAEDVHGYTTLFQQLFTTHGLPLAIYGDRLNLLVRNDRHWSVAKELAGTQFPTHLGRMLQDLGIAYIAAHSPQAKGRVERLWATLQDRLVSELRARGVILLDVTKSGKRREVPLNSRADAVLARRGSKSSGLVFGTRKWDHFRSAWERAVDRAKLVDFHFHDLRHTFASWAVQRGASLQEVKDLLGHHSLAMTLRYGHLALEHLRSAVARLDTTLPASDSAQASTQEGLVQEALLSK
jgi:hypothetical protein